MFDDLWTEIYILWINVNIKKVDYICILILFFFDISYIFYFKCYFLVIVNVKSLLADIINFLIYYHTMYLHESLLCYYIKLVYTRISLKLRHVWLSRKNKIYNLIKLKKVIRRQMIHLKRRWRSWKQDVD